MHEHIDRSGQTWQQQIVYRTNASTLKPPDTKKMRNEFAHHGRAVGSLTAAEQWRTTVKTSNKSMFDPITDKAPPVCAAAHAHSWASCGQARGWGRAANAHEHFVRACMYASLIIAAAVNGSRREVCDPGQLVMSKERPKLRVDRLHCRALILHPSTLLHDAPPPHT